MKYVAPVTINGIEEAGVVTKMFDIFGRDTNDPEKAEAFVVECSQGFINASTEIVAIHSVH